MANTMALPRVALRRVRLIVCMPETKTMDKPRRDKTMLLKRLPIASSSNVGADQRCHVSITEEVTTILGKALSAHLRPSALTAYPMDRSV